MTTKELKSKLKAEIESLESPEVLEMMDMILDTYKDKKLIITDKHIEFLEKSNSGEIYTNEEAKKESAKWLKD